ncbi:hypothetical protein WR25_26487 [Diploscapter pachys]|uniref:Uncharacterized protein n=1 Tax=Diploscapter pachys TaxID=2018661 RepID=A0A2A2KS10_9BILA|nr:hypothetical protein WR25_26487 [Diploscapter pachys]
MPRERLISIVRDGNLIEDSLPMLPDEVLEMIIDQNSPTELVAFGWDSVNRGFASAVRRSLQSRTRFCVPHDPIWAFYKNAISSGCISTNAMHEKLMTLLIQKYFIYVEDMVMPIALFSYLQSVIAKLQEEFPKSQKFMPKLKTLTIQIGGEWGPLTLSQNFNDLKIALRLCNALQEINLDILLTDEEQVTCCGLRELSRFLMEIADEKTKWNVVLEDHTLCGQGYFGPLEMNRCRNKAFICQVRALLDVGVPLNRLVLLDRRKPSPYMLVMPNAKRRSLYMYPEFKLCHELVVCYDIGLVAPIFAHENEQFGQLEIFEVDESHVLYKKDLLEYLGNAPNLSEIRIVLPATWTRRVQRCTKGCFGNPDFNCFRADGWRAVHIKLPRAKLAIIEGSIQNQSQGQNQTQNQNNSFGLPNIYDLIKPTVKSMTCV